jgi:hypothetical protein
MVHLAVAPQGAAEEIVWAVNVAGTRHLYQACRAAGVRRFLFFSSQSAHPGATSAYGRSKQEAEAWLRGRDDVVIIRPGLVYGDGDEGLLGRAVGLASRFRIFPAVGGRAARAQVIHVDDLVGGVLRAAALARPPAELALADPTARPLADLIQQLAAQRSQVRVHAVTIPLTLASLGAAVAEGARLPLPFNSENIAGISSFRAMDTVAPLEQLGVTLRPIGALSPRDEAPGADRAVNPRRLLIVGAGRIGVVHGLAAFHHQSVVPVALCDLQARAMHRLLGVTGVTLPCYTRLDQALREQQPDVAVLCTPPDTHPALTAQLLDAGVDVLVEKPVAIDQRSRTQLRAAASAHPSRVVATGYVATVLP